MFNKIMHIPVLLNEILRYLDPKPGDNFIDCTVGEGGHALAILKMTAPNGKLIGIDRDADMVERLRARAEDMGVGERFIIHHGNFADIRKISEGYDFYKVNGALFDFGMSSWQIDESGMGFSFQNIEPLDMRYDRTKNTPTAANIINSWPEASLARIIYEFGEERYSRRIAKEIVMARKKEHITTTDELVRIIFRAVPRVRAGKPGIHFATRTFQAFRIAINMELENVEAGLEEAIYRVEIGGKVAAISFHSLEDRIVKNTFKKYSRPRELEGGVYFNRAEGGVVKIITKKPVNPAAEEIFENPRARSAKLRVSEKVSA